MAGGPGDPRPSARSGQSPIANRIGFKRWSRRLTSRRGYGASEDSVGCGSSRRVARCLRRLLRHRRRRRCRPPAEDGGGERFVFPLRSPRLGGGVAADPAGGTGPLKKSSGRTLSPPPPPSPPKTAVPPPPPRTAEEDALSSRSPPPESGGGRAGDSLERVLANRRSPIAGPSEASPKPLTPRASFDTLSSGIHRGDPEVLTHSRLCRAGIAACYPGSSSSSGRPVGVALRRTDHALTAV